MKKLLYLLILLPVLLILSSCQKNSTTSDPSSSSNNNETPTVSSTQATTEGVPADALYITFIGNSLAKNGSMPKYFTKLAKAMNKNVIVQTVLTDGFTLEQHSNNSKNKGKSIHKYITNSDIIVFQEYGSNYGTTAKDIRDMGKLAKKDAKLYYLTTDFDIFVGAEHLKEIEKNNVTIIPAAYCMYSLNEVGIDFESLFVPNDYHPSIFNGYLTATVTYSTLFNENCADISFSTVEPLILIGLNGDTSEERNNSFNDLMTCFDEYIKKFDTSKLDQLLSNAGQ